VIKWKDIKRIGDDVILVDVAGILGTDIGLERNHMTNISSYSGTDRERDKNND
jgi:hypothetical protein